jgi:hypothetical protein
MSDIRPTDELYPTMHYATKQHTDPVNGEVYTNVCLEPYSAPKYPDHPIGGRPEGDGFLGRAWDRMHADRLDRMQAYADVLADGSWTLHGSTPTLGGTTAAAAAAAATTTAASSSSPGGAAMDAATNELESWNAVIPFSIIEPYSIELEHCDNILDYLKPAWKDCKFYFSFSKYAVDVLEDESPGWDLLKKDLVTAAFDNGTGIVSNGGGKKERRFRCNACFLYKQGKAVNADKKCSMHFSVLWDDKGYYLPGGRRGNVMHSNHIRFERQQMLYPKILRDDTDIVSCEGPGTETVFTALSNQIASLDPLIKEISALYEGNSTQAEIDECKTFLAAQMAACKIFLNSKIATKKAELGKPNAEGPKGKRVSSSVVSNNKKHRTQDL